MIKSLLVCLFTLLNRVFIGLFGHFSWTSPLWLKKLTHLARYRPVVFMTSLIALLLICLGIGYGFLWYKNRPQPTYVTAVIQAPAITPLEETLVPQDLVIDFGIQKEEWLSQAVAPITLVGKTVPTGVTMSPNLPGTWFWQTDSRLVFSPSEDWPAGQTFKVHFDPILFSHPQQMQQFDYEFHTAVFAAKIEELKLYQNPDDPADKQIVATVDFNFPVDTTSLEELAAIVSESKTFSPSPISITYDAHKRVAYIHSKISKLPDLNSFIHLVIHKGVKAAKGPGKLSQVLSKDLMIPNASHLFKVLDISATIIRNQQDQPEQILNVETSLGVLDAALNERLHVYLLPRDYPATSIEQEKKDYRWSHPGEVTSTILSLAKPLTLQGLPADRNFASLHSYRFNSSTPQYLYVKIDKGLVGVGDYQLTEDYSTIIEVPPYPQEIGFLHHGALLALAGEKKVSVTVRGLSAVKFNIARVLPDNINQLITQTEGDFNNPYFLNQSFNQDNISQIFAEIQQFNDKNPNKLQYSSLDLGKYLNHEQSGQGPHGLFLLTAQAWDVEKNQPLDIKKNRLILITDLAMLVKDNLNGSHDVYVQSITKGQPVQLASVSILGKNGLPIMSQNTDEQGHVFFPDLADYVNEKEPIVYLASLKNDVSFIPYKNEYRELNYSRFDVGGIDNNQELGNLSAYIFTDRGIYRPGDDIHLATIVKKAYAQSQPAGLPLEIIITDPRGNTVLDERFSLNSDGLKDFHYQTTATSSTGQYQINVYTIKDNTAGSLLGNSSFQVAEFQPDRLRIQSQFSQNSSGWISPKALKAKVILWNLFGTPASQRRVTGKLLLIPEKVTFAAYPDYIFTDPLVNPEKPAKLFTENLPETKTNDQGEAIFSLSFDQFMPSTYKLTLFAEGFEAESGRSVTSQTTALVSPLPYLVGYKADGDLNFIKQNDKRIVHFIALDPQLKPYTIDNLKTEIYSLTPVVTLVKKPNGTYEYQKVIQSTVVRFGNVHLDSQGINFSLPTQEIGNYVLKISNENQIVSQLKFTVVGDSKRPIAKNAELTVKINKKEYQLDEDIELEITAPYIGSGLMTIERDRVYASQWFHTDSTNSVQKIHIPKDFQGNGYLNVSFVRDWDSPEIFISPLSYAVLPFSVSHEQQTMHIQLAVPELVKPGDALKINYQSDKPGKMIIFAIDEGILQVSRYITPDPLAFFFQKRALQVITQQTVDQILPKFMQEREASAVGGDGSEALLANHLNPFKRKTDAPVVFWSGIVDVDNIERELTYNIPDYFNGSLRIMAVAVGFNELGSAEKQTRVHGDFIINPNVPVFVAPGDEFTVSASIANQLQGSGLDASVQTKIIVSPELEVLGSQEQRLSIAENQEGSIQFKIRAKQSLGEAKITFVAEHEHKQSQMHSFVSIRPVAPYITQINSGINKQKIQNLPLTSSSFYPQNYAGSVAISKSPLILVQGLKQFLDNYPYGCTEQLTSKALPLLAILDAPWLNNNPAELKEKINQFIASISQRQMTNGGFSYWPNNDNHINNDFASIYAMHFFTEAKEKGFEIPAHVFSYGLSYLREFAERSYVSAEQAKLQAYAIYLLTRNEIVTTNYITHLEYGLDQDKNNQWRKNLTGAYLAASYQLLKNTTTAESLIRQYQMKDSQSSDYFAATDNAQYFYLLARHFPQLSQTQSKQYVKSLVESLTPNQLSTLVAGYSALALSAYSAQVASAQALPIQIKELQTNQTTQILQPLDKAFIHLALSLQTASLEIFNNKQEEYYYQLMESGFHKQQFVKAFSHGMEIDREYRDPNGQAVENIYLGDELEVHILLRSQDNNYINNVVVLDLLPGGFEVVRDSIKNMPIDYADIREDRVVFFLSLGPDSQELVYRIKAINVGSYQVPPILGESMYDPKIKAMGELSRVTVVGK